jgi:hypothetical protein
MTATHLLSFQQRMQLPCFKAEVLSMAKRPKKQIGDAVPVTGGVTLPAHLVCSPSSDDDLPTDDLGRQAYWLLKLNAE